MLVDKILHSGIFTHSVFLLIVILQNRFKNTGMIFRQNGSWWSRREYVIEQNGVKVNIRSLSGTTNKFFDFHKIGKIIVRKRKKRWFWLFMAVILFGYGGWLSIDVYQGVQDAGNALGCIILSLLFTVLFPGQKHLYLHNPTNMVSIEFLDNVPTEDAVTTFIAHIRKAQRIRLQQLYVTIDENMSYDEYRNNIQWLWDNDFLSQKEAEQRLGVAISNFT